MARMYKMTAYLVDPNEVYENAEAWFEKAIAWSEIFCPMPIEHESVSFEWQDDLPINYLGCTKLVCESFFSEKRQEELLQRLAQRLRDAAIRPISFECDPAAEG